MGLQDWDKFKKIPKTVLASDIPELKPMGTFPSFPNREKSPPEKVERK